MSGFLFVYLFVCFCLLACLVLFCFLCVVVFGFFVCLFVCFGGFLRGGGGGDLCLFSLCLLCFILKAFNTGFVFRHLPPNFFQYRSRYDDRKH